MNIALQLIKTGHTVNDMGGMGDYMIDGWNFWLWVFGSWLILMVIASLVYLDARDRNMSGLLWFALVILPVIGFFFLVMYLVARDDRYEYEMSKMSPEVILNQRYARGEITGDEYRHMKRCITEEATHDR